MASRLSIENDRLKVGQVKRVTSNPNIDMSNLDCTIDKETLRDLVISFKDAYNQIITNESEGTNS